MVKARQPEIEDLDAARGGSNDVLGLEIPVDDPMLVGDSEGAGDLDTGVQEWSERQRVLESLDVVEIR